TDPNGLALRHGRGKWMVRLVRLGDVECLRPGRRRLADLLSIGRRIVDRVLRAPRLGGWPTGPRLLRHGPLRKSGTGPYENLLDRHGASGGLGQFARDRRREQLVRLKRHRYTGCLRCNQRRRGDPVPHRRRPVATVRRSIPAGTGPPFRRRVRLRRRGIVESLIDNEDPHRCRRAHDRRWSVWDRRRERMVRLGRNSHVDRLRFRERRRVDRLPPRWRRLDPIRRAVLDFAGRPAPPRVRLRRQSRQPGTHRPGFRGRGSLEAVLPLPHGVGERDFLTSPDYLECGGQRLRDRRIRGARGRRRLLLGRHGDVSLAEPDRRFARGSCQGPGRRGTVDDRDVIHPSPFRVGRAIRIPVPRRRGTGRRRRRDRRIPRVARPSRPEHEVPLIRRSDPGNRNANVRDGIRFLRFHSRWYGRRFRPRFLQGPRLQAEHASAETRRRRTNRMIRAILVALLLLTVGVAASTPSRRTMPAPAVLTGSAAPGAFFDYVLVIVMENHNICDLLASCGGTASYLSDLAGSYGVATKEMYCHVNPSLPNYLCLTSGSDFGCTADPGPNSTTFTKT